jgi:hypothetical protein
MSRHLIAVAAVVSLAGWLLAAPAPSDTTFTPIDLKAYTNAKLKDPLHGGDEGNDLANLPAGKQTFADVRFTVGDEFIQLGSARVKGPEKVEGIKVGRFVGKLHFLHSCGCGYNTADDTLIGKYVVHYDDKTTADIEIVYGKDVVDWWVGADRKDPTRSKVGWEGENAPAKAAGSKIKLSVSAWENPHPKKKVVSIDYVATEAATDVCPFCVAITAQDK